MPIIGRFWSRIHDWLDAQVETVPEAIEVCEFDCTRAVCTAQQIVTCERRLNFLARCIAAAQCRRRQQDGDEGRPSVQ